MSRPRPGIGRRLLRALGGILVILAITFAALEVGLRLFPQAIPLAWLERFGDGVRTEVANRLGLPNADIVYLLARQDGGPPLRMYKPNAEVSLPTRSDGGPAAVRLDRNGFCNPDDAINALAKVDLVAIGDSFTFCTKLAAADTWPARLGAASHRTVLNLGVPGVGIDEYLEVLRVFGLPRHPAVVILNIYEGNDLRDAVRYRDFVAEHRSGAPEKASRRSLVSGWLGRNSYAWNLIVSGIDAASGEIRRRRNPKGEIDFHYDLALADRTIAFNVENGDLDEVRSARGVAAGKLDPAWLDPGLERFAAQARQSGFVPLVTYAPAAYTAYDRFVKFSDPELAPLMAAYSRRLRDHLREACQRLGLRFVDLTPALQAAAATSREPLYGYANLHFTPAGTAVVAATLAPVVEELFR
ncbi:MAG: GDSL-type esterase/lipase family protein [Dongiaceae bacterium]